jgi:hypothetical protein
VGAFDSLEKQRTVVVTTYKRDGSAVPTPVNLMVDGEHAFFRTWSTSGKAKRLGRDPSVLIAPSTVRGKPTGPPVAASARLLGPAEEVEVKHGLARKHPIMHGVLVPFAHWIRHYTTVHYELTAR